MSRTTKAGPTPPPTDQGGGAIDVFEQLKANIQGSAFAKVYRLDPSNPSDINGDYIGRVNVADDFDEEAIRAEFGGGLFKVQLCNPKGQTVSGITRIRIEGPPRLRPAPPPLLPAQQQQPIQGVTHQQLGTVHQAATPPARDELAELRAELEQLKRGRGLDGNVNALTARDFLDLMRANLPAQTNAFNLQTFIAAIPAITAFIQTLTPKGDLESALMLAKRMTGKTGGEAEAKADPWSEVAVAAINSTPLARLCDAFVKRMEAGTTQTPAAQPGAQPAAAPPAQLQQPAAAAPTTTGTPAAPTYGAKLTDIQRTGVRMLATQLADNLQAKPNAKPEAVAEDVLDAIDTEVVYPILENLQHGELAYLVAQGDARLADKVPYLLMVEASVRHGVMLEMQPDDDNKTDAPEVAGKVGVP